MVEEVKQNPLFKAEREKAGAETFDKYDYQYHWALYKVISEHINFNEYAVFMEYHEDVVISNSLDSEIAEFEFNQVKTVQTKYNTYNLTLQKNASKGKKKPSVLGKLMMSADEKSFKDRISSINLIATSGFSLEYKEKGLLLDKIKLEDLSKKDFDALEKAIKDELEISNLPLNIQFIIPDLPERKYDDVVIANIARLVSNLYPHSQTDSVEIYRILIDGLRKKGKIKYDYKEWNDLLKNKALTSSEISKVLSDFTSLKDETKIDLEFIDICNEINIKSSIARRELRNAFNRYRQLRISNKSTNQIDTKIQIVNLIDEHIGNINHDFNLLLEKVIENLSDNTKRLFVNDIELKAAIICEYIMKY